MTNLNELNRDELYEILEQIGTQEMLFDEQRKEIYNAISAITEREYQEEMASVDYAEKQKKIEIISEKTEQALALIRECEELAKQCDFQFGFKVDYGMGGTYTRKPGSDHETIEWGWEASSHRC